MPIDGQSTRQRPHEPKSTPEAKFKGANGESGVPPTERRTPAGPPPLSRNPPPTPPASFASKVDAKEDPQTLNSPQNQLEILANRSGTHDFVNKQRRDTVSLSTADTSRRTLNSLYTTDVFTYSDPSLVGWFRKDRFFEKESNRTDVPFFSTPSLASLMLKDKPTFKDEVKKIQDKLLEAEGPELEELLVTLTESIVEHYNPSVPTTIKMAVYLITTAEEISDESLIGLDNGASKVGLITSFIESYYQVDDDDLQTFFEQECNQGTLAERGSIAGSFDQLPGYTRLRADRQVFTREDTASEYDETWIDFWRMLKSILCFESDNAPDIDLAQRQRIINGNPSHPLRQQFTTTGLEPARLWLGRLKRADDAGRDFQRRIGFDCGLTLDDMGQISVATDAMHDALKHTFDLELMRRGAEIITVPRINHAGIAEPDRQLPKITWQTWKEAFIAAYKLYKAQLNKQSYPPTNSKPIVSKLKAKRQSSQQDTNASDEPTQKSKPCKWCGSTEHFTADCPSEGRRTAGVCRAYQRGKCRQGARHCKYLHIREPLEQQGSNTESNLTQSDHKSRQNSPNNTNSPSNGGQLTDHNLRNPTNMQCPDDFTKPCDRICVVPGCGKAFHLPLEGEFGVKWYGSKGMFLPKRCDDCIKTGKRMPRPTSLQGVGPQESQTQLCDTNDPEAVDALICCSIPGGEEPEHTQAYTFTWCESCGAKMSLSSLKGTSVRCTNCPSKLPPDGSNLDDVIDISLPPSGSCSLMIELSDSSSDCSSDSSTPPSDDETPACAGCGAHDSLCACMRCPTCRKTLNCACNDHNCQDAQDQWLATNELQNEWWAYQDCEESTESTEPASVTRHMVHAALLEQWSGLELYPTAFSMACDVMVEFFSDGCSSVGGLLKWNRAEVDPTGEVVGRLFKHICRSTDANGISSDQIELAYGLGQAVAQIAKQAIVSGSNHSWPTTSPSDSSTEGSEDCKGSPRNSPADFFTRICNEYAGACGEAQPYPTAGSRVFDRRSIAANRGRRTAKKLGRYSPSQTGIKREVLTPDEYHAAVADEELSDATIRSEDDMALSGSQESLVDKLAGLDPSSGLDCLLGVTTPMINGQDSEVVSSRSGFSLDHACRYRPRHPLPADHLWLDKMPILVLSNIHEISKKVAGWGYSSRFESRLMFISCSVLYAAYKRSYKLRRPAPGGWGPQPTLAESAPPECDGDALMGAQDFQ